jgi:hypothetical protein
LEDELNYFLNGGQPHLFCICKVLKKRLCKEEFKWQILYWAEFSSAGVYFLSSFSFTYFSPSRGFHRVLKMGLSHKILRFDFFLITLNRLKWQENWSEQCSHFFDPDNCAEKILLVLMGARAELQACADPGARTQSF